MPKHPRRLRGAAFFCIPLAAAAALSLLACGQGRKAEQPKSVVLRTAASFDAVSEFVGAVGGDKVSVRVMVPAGMEPHDFEPKAQDLKLLAEADLLFYGGLDMEAWVDRTAAAAGNGRLKTVAVSDGFPPIENSDPDAVKEHGRFDPHFWLSPLGAAQAARNVCAALSAADPADAAYFEKNRDAFVADLEAVRKAYADRLSGATSKDFVAGHAAFAYLCRDFGLRQNSVENAFAEGEPTAKQLRNLVDFCREKNVSTIFAEELASPAVSETLAKEVGAKVETIYTMESPEDGKTYIERLRSNLEKIALSLGR